MILLALLVGMMVFVLWYVIDRRAQNRAREKPVAIQPLNSAEPVALGGVNERKTVDFSSGQPVVKNTPEDQAAIEAALKDMAEATQGVTFGPPKKPAASERK